MTALSVPNLMLKSWNTADWTYVLPVIAGMSGAVVAMTS